ncbi:A/G-specific DNA-adenine glycosylase [Prosthecobacter fusiformis]|uniref:Adenine DNA glycosylase n=1 Tax=Prosthecobacter fusiformis TaxID=48464 RepID=A0A4R7SS40_9BACT|nr:A/G-specific adenine glycosylase [Prosthecobacter fusiformis]TDU81545.1 A/G-specific DNA-adenine glycosylase [Prosthecobacter fusiformis]
MPASSLAADLVSWFHQTGRVYPWRQTRDPYAILVSEVMLQQTQISTVLGRGYYARWLLRFPDFATLAAASESDILTAWEGLGYYRRARNLQKLAQVVMAEHAGIFPQEPAAILALPGIGPYTAGAISSFAFGLNEPIVDGNVARVLSRLDNDATPIDSTAGSKRLWERATELVRATDDPRALNSALMELGQTICKPALPQCPDCPVKKHCHAIDPSGLPVKSNKTQITEVTERVIFLQTPQGVLLEQETGARRTGLWKLPALPEDAEPTPPLLLKTTYGITRYKVTLWVHEAPPNQMHEWPASHRLIPHAELATTAMPSPYRRALEKLLKNSLFRLES